MEQIISYLSKIITHALISNILEAVLLISRILVCITSSFTFDFFAVLLMCTHKMQQMQHLLSQQ